MKPVYHKFEGDRRWIDELKANVVLSSVIQGHGVSLKRSGRSMVGRCPFHDDSTPSFYVHDHDHYYYCFGCKASGDALTFLQQAHNVTFIEAAEMLGARNFVPLPIRRTAEPSSEAVQERARRAWDASVAITDTPAATYLESRCIPIDLASQQSNIRFDRSPYYSAARHPALVAAFRNLDDQVVALQRTFLTENGSKTDARCKRMQGSIRGAAIKLNTHVPGAESEGNIILCEGLEDGLTLARMYPAEMVWVTGGTGNFESVNLPPSCRSVTIAPDNDDAGWRAAHNLSKRLMADNMDFDILLPEIRFKDWNEWLCHYEQGDPSLYAPLPWRDNSAYYDDDDISWAIDEVDLIGRGHIDRLLAGDSFPSDYQAWLNSIQEEAA